MTHRMTCCVCGEDAGRWHQHWNRDTGFGICMKCIGWVRSRSVTEAEIADLYGEEGVNFGSKQPRTVVWLTSVGILSFTDPQASCDFETDLVEWGYLNGRHTVVSYVRHTDGTRAY